MLKLSPDFLLIANFSFWALPLAHFVFNFCRIFISRKRYSRFYTELLGFAGSVYLPFLQANRQSLASGIIQTYSIQIYEKLSEKWGW